MTPPVCLMLLASTTPAGYRTASKTSPIIMIKKFLHRPVLAGLLAAACLWTPNLPAADDLAADKAWLEVLTAAKLPEPPEQWRTSRPKPEEEAKFRVDTAKLALAAADKAKAFYTEHPAHRSAAGARAKEYELLHVAQRFGETKLTARLDDLLKARLSDPKLSDDERFKIRAEAVQRAAMARQAEGMPAILAEFEKGARVLLKDFPKRPEPYDMLLEVASNTDGDKARALAKELSESTDSEKTRSSALAILKKMDAIGKPVAISFTAVDGTKVDLTKMQGKVVLVDFWATWCGPCVAGLPEIMGVYEKLHSKGFEIVGISFDQKKEKLTQFTTDKKMPWVQYFDGLGWGNKIGQEYGINSIPAMWLIDKKGVLRDMNGRANLAEKVEKFLAEK